MQKALIISLLLTISILSNGQIYNVFVPKQINSVQSQAQLDYAEANLSKAWDSFNQGDLEKTRYYLAQSESDGWVNASFYNLLALWCVEKGNYAAAKRYWNRAYKKRGCYECKEIVKNMNSDKSYKKYLLGSIYHRRNQFEAAIKEFDNCININPKNIEAVFLRALSKEGLKNIEGAIADYSIILELESSVKSKSFTMGTVYNNLAYGHVQLEHYTEALSLVNKAINLEPNEDYIWETRGEAFYYLGEYEKCINDMTKSIELLEGKKSKAPNLEPGSAFYFRAMANIKLTNLQNVCQDFTKAKELGTLVSFELIQKYCNQ